MGNGAMDAMQDLPNTEFEFEQRFSTEEACVEYLRTRRWPNGFICPKCRGRRSWQIRTRRLDECASCGHQVSITAGTIFENTRKSLVLWFRVIRDFLASKRGCSAKEIQRRYGLSYKTAWTWLHKIRSFMDRHAVRPLHGAVEVGGMSAARTADSRCQVTETASNRHQVVIAVENKGPRMGRLRLGHIETGRVEHLLGFLSANVASSSAIRIEDLPAPGSGGDERFLHRSFVVGDLASPRKRGKVHRVVTLLRRVLLGTYQGAVGSKHRQLYLDEFVFRFNRRTSNSRYLLFERLLGEVFQSPPTYSAIVQGTLCNPRTT